MARKHKNTSQAARRAGRPKRAKAAPKIDPEQAFMEDIATEMLDVITCPIMIADDHATRIADMLFDAETGRDLADVGARVHPDAAVAPVLADVASLLDRHARELGALLDRLIPHTNHDMPHDHVVPEDDAVRQMLFALFGDPRESQLRSEGEP